jgi:regulator of sigma E protease
MSILIFFVVLFILVLVHEWGHYITAKLTGMRVDEFGIGFPPKLFGVKKGETEYTVNALPIGGFVKIYGEDGVGDPEQRNEETQGAFTSKSKWAQALVLVAGVSMNIIFAWFLFSGAFMWGIERAVDEGSASPNARLVVTDVLAEGPAADAELPRGAFITTVSRGEEDLTSLTPASFSEFVGRTNEEPVRITYTRGDELFMTSIVPRTNVIDADPERQAIGVALTLVDTVQYPFLAALKEGFTHTIESTVAITVGVVGLIRDVVVGQADFTQVAGPVGIVGLVGEASAFGFSALLMFTAFISLNLAVINLLPFPALDGGRLLFVGIEAITRRPMPVRATQIMNTVGFFVLIGLMVVVTWNDISKLI